MAETFREDEWVVEKGLAERTGLVTRQIKEYRMARWIEGVHFKRHSAHCASGSNATIWYNYTKINRLVREA
ncbi:TPA: excisionase family protein [Klebsiella pneumoniae]|uniref:excisionase family protein n=1 Tax=Klebsiella pneumoniae TaxID=573 RepID=UPI001C7F9375|nr:excisionase family protein [Klebsiella pneumoniae]MBX4517587.1 hypothetical protein [Klebsiella pneumoniae]HCF8671105.1 excisionase family protein [Klebsiella pneumoniae]HCT7764656.1 excisionase family protein [Klebsiella pneumoniae]